MLYKQIVLTDYANHWGNSILIRSIYVNFEKVLKLDSATYLILAVILYSQNDLEKAKWSRIYHLKQKFGVKENIIVHWK